MTEEQWYFYRKPEHDTIYHRATHGLPLLMEGEPYGCGPHNYRAFEFALARVKEAVQEQRPLRVFEIGFNLGYSASLFLENGCALRSIDIRGVPRMRSAAKTLQSRGGDFEMQFEVTVDTCVRPPWTPDLAFIDGAHDYASIRKDIRYCRDTLKVQRFLMDDWPLRYGDTEKAVLSEGLLALHIMGSMAYCIVPEADGYFTIK